jgi:hypothetical protein
MPSIFVSHSAKTPFAKKVRDCVAARLEEMGFEVLLDKNLLDPGDAWRAQLHRWLARCQGGVILFSREALDSGWVLKEATILTWRHALNPRVRVVPALLGDVRPEETGMERFAPLQLGEIQFARLDSAGETDAEAQALAEEIVRPFQGLTWGDADPAIDAWLRNLRIWLRQADPESLEQAARLLGIGAAATREELVEVFACHLLCLDLERAMPALRVLAAGLPVAPLQRLLGLVIPLWVSQEAARHILPVARLDAADRCLAIDGRYWETGLSYIRRATCCAPDPIVIRATDVAGEWPEEELLAAYDQAIRRDLNIPASRPASTVQKRIAASPQPFFVVAGEAALEAGVLASLRRLYAGVILVLLSGDRPLPSCEELRLPVLRSIEPRLGLDAEERADILVSEARSILQQARTAGGYFHGES